MQDKIIVKGARANNLKNIDVTIPRDKLVVMTGGVAQNTGVVKALEEELGRTIHTSPLTQYNGALGAALFAYDRYKRAHKD